MMQGRTIVALLLATALGAVAASAQTDTSDQIEYRECEWGLLLVASSEATTLPPVLLTAVASGTQAAPVMPPIATIMPEATETPLANGMSLVVSDNLSMTGDSRLLRVESSDMLLRADDPCAAAADEFRATITSHASVTAVSLTQDTLTVYGQGSSHCTLTLRLRLVQIGNSYSGDVYYASAAGAAQCTLDLKPFSLSIPLDVQPEDIVTVNGLEAALR